MRTDKRICMMWLSPIPSSETASAVGARHMANERADTPGHIMIVDDSHEVGAALGRLLEMSDHTVELIADGRAALNAVERRQPDLIILDVQLPGMDGYAVCAALKRNRATWQIPI